jgi:hypothetical protein
MAREMDAMVDGESKVRVMRTKGQLCKLPSESACIQKRITSSGGCRSPGSLLEGKRLKAPSAVLCPKGKQGIPAPVTPSEASAEASAAGSVCRPM